MSATGVNEAWQRIESWLAGHAPGAYASLRPPADAGRIAAAAREIGVRFPEDLVASLLRHDGCHDVPEALTLAGPYRPSTVEEIVEEWRGKHRDLIEGFAEDELGEDYWSDGYLPFAGAVTTVDGLVVDVRPQRLDPSWRDGFLADLGDVAVPDGGLAVLSAEPEREQRPVPVRERPQRRPFHPEQQWARSMPAAVLHAELYAEDSGHQAAAAAAGAAGGPAGPQSQHIPKSFSRACPGRCDLCRDPILRRFAGKVECSGRPYPGRAVSPVCDVSKGFRWPGNAVVR